QTQAQDRDLALAYLLLLQIATNREHPPAGTLLEQLRVLRDDDLDRIGEAVREGGTGIPARLVSGGASGLSAVLNGATEPDLLAREAGSAAIKVERILGDRSLAGLLALSDFLQPVTDSAKKHPAFRVLPLMTVDGGWAASTLWPDDRPAAGHPLF